MIKKGYQLHITTWENDGDDYRTAVVSGLTKEDTKFYISLASRFKSDHQHSDKTKLTALGNEGIDTARLVAVIDQELENHPDISAEVRKYWQEAVDHDKEKSNGGWIYESLCETLLHSPVSEYYRWDYTHFCRVFESFKVVFVPEDCPDVTSEFK